MFITRAALFFSALVSAAFPAFSQTYPTRSKWWPLIKTAGIKSE